MMPRFDAVAANPPFSYRWDPGEAVAEDMLFKDHLAAPSATLLPDQASFMSSPPALGA
jgi:hypothetical protein